MLNIDAIRKRDERCSSKDQGRVTSRNLAFKDRHELLAEVIQLRASLAEAEKRAVKWREPKEKPEHGKNIVMVLEGRSLIFGRYGTFYGDKPGFYSYNNTIFEPIKWCYVEDLLATLPEGAQG